MAGLGLMLTAAWAALAAPGDPEYTRCVDATATNRGYAECGSALIARRDAELNRVWRSVYPGLDADTKAALLAEQRLWIAFKDESCAAWRSGYFGREGQVLHFFACRADVIDARIGYLQSLAA